MSFASPDHQRLIRQFETIAALSEADKSMLGALPMRIVQIQDRHDIIREGDSQRECFAVLDGFACRYKLVAEGDRQILGFHFPGDVPDLASIHLKKSDHAICAMTPTRIGYITHEVLRDVADRSPSIAALFAAHCGVEASIQREWIANIGRRLARPRLAHLFCEFYVRSSVLGLVTNDGITLPLTQSDLGDATGLSVVHVNRVLQQLRKEGLIRSHGKHHAVSNWAELKRAGDFNARYLHLRAPVPGLNL